MGKNMWQEMGANNEALGGGEGDRLLVSEKSEPVYFQPQSNINKQKYQNSRAFQGNSPSPNDHSCIIFVDQENNKHFQPRMRSKRA
jgi:hypothetical protein